MSGGQPARLTHRQQRLPRCIRIAFQRWQLSPSGAFALLGYQPLSTLLTKLDFVHYEIGACADLIMDKVSFNC